jgi:hypothetical protein
MPYPININKITASSIEFYDEVSLLLTEAKKYLAEHPWCSRILNGWLFTNIGKVFCIFLFEIENAQSVKDNYLWVIVGDIPPMYLDRFDVSGTREVVETYIYLVDEWIAAVENKESLEEVYPLDSDTSEASIQMLKERLKFLQDEILPNIEDLSFAEINN